jgi:hypothetical protein
MDLRKCLAEAIGTFWLTLRGVAVRSSQQVFRRSVSDYSVCR